MTTVRESSARLVALAAMKDRVDVEYEAARQQVAKDLLEVNKITGTKPSAPIDIDGVGRVGTVTLGENKDTVDIFDEAAFLSYVREHYPSEIESVPQVRRVFRDAFKKALTSKSSVEAGGVDFTTGEVFDVAKARDNGGERIAVRGVKAVKGVGYKSYPSLTGLDSAAVIAAMLDGRMEQPALTAGPAIVEPTPAAVDPSVVEGEVVEAPLTAESLAEVKDRKKLQQMCEDRGIELPASGWMPKKARQLLLEHEENAVAARAWAVGGAALIGERIIAQGQAMNDAAAAAAL